MAAHDSYTATLSIAHARISRRRYRPRCLSVISPCPAGNPSRGFRRTVRIAVASGLFPLYEVYDGYRINAEPDGTDRPNTSIASAASG